MVRPLASLLEDADAFLMGRSRIHDTARRLAERLDGLGIDYAVAGALALGAHGRVRLTEDVDVLLRPADLARFKEVWVGDAWLGRGYVEPVPGNKAVRDTETGVRIDFLLSGEFPGDGRPKPVAFPEPAGEDSGGFRVLPLDVLLTLKLASGMTAPHRGQDLVDVMELIRARSLPRAHAQQLDAYVRAKFLEQWELAQVRDDY